MAGNQKDGYSYEALQRLKEVLDDEGKDPISLPLPLLKKITKNFSEDEEIGRGGFAAVYKGRLPKGQVVAVKKIDTSKTDARYLEHEIECMKRAKHKNVIRLLGYYWAHDETENVVILCSEYVPNGSLSRYLKDKFLTFQWSTRYQIAKGICQGVEYLHSIDIIHGDLKPDNILLDQNMVPKIADFGLSRCCPQGQTDFSTDNFAYTCGYVAPELARIGAFAGRKLHVYSKDTDVYSLGVITMDLLVGKDRYKDFLWGPEEGHLKVETVLNIWRTENEEQPLPETMLQQVKVCAEIAMECVEDVHRKKEQECMAYDRETKRPLIDIIINDIRVEDEPGPSNLPSDGQLEASTSEKRCDPQLRPSASEIIHRLDETENEKDKVLFSLHHAHGIHQTANALSMVRSFLEDGGSAAERGAAARCYNCFHAGDTSDDKDGPAAADVAAADIAETIKGLVHCASLRERNLLADVSTLVERHRAFGTRRRDLLRLLAESLRALGHDAAVCLSRWDKSPSHPAGEHAYLDVLLPAASKRGERERVLVDVDFRSAFEVARPTKAYRAVLQRLPSVFVGRDDRLRLLVAAVADAVRASLKKRGLHLPPWRKLEYMLAKWQSPYDREDPAPPPQPEATTGELAGDGEGGGPSA